LYEQYVSALADLFLPQRCVGCDTLASDLPCRDCFEALPRVGRPVCARCGMPTAFETFVCDACKGLDFGFESARAPLRYEGVGEEIVHALKYRGYAKVVERVHLDGAPRAGRRGGAGRTSFRYTRSGAQDSGSGRAHGSREAGERRGSLRNLGTRAGQGPPRRRRLSSPPVRRGARAPKNPPARRGTRGGVRGEPVQDGMRACQLVSTSAFQLTPARLVLSQRAGALVGSASTNGLCSNRERLAAIFC
jgi:hypothetical protein